METSRQQKCVEVWHKGGSGHSETGAKSRARPLVESTSLLEVIKVRCDSAENPEWMSPGVGDMTPSMYL